MTGGGERPGWRLVEMSAGADGWHALIVRSGATSRELVAGAAALPPSVLADTIAMDRSGTAAVLMFRDFPDGVVADSAPWPPPIGPARRDDPAEAPTVTPGGPAAGWVPTLGPGTDAIHGLTPFDFAVWELLHAARHSSAGAWIMTLVRLVPPPAVVALAELLREARGDGCTCQH